MKLSRRGKRAKHTRRGKHTKRVRKHHTRRIKHRGKQYKRTYRKHNRKLKHNKRIQRGGVIEWTSMSNNVKYKSNDFTVTMDRLSDKDHRITEKQFVLYFKLGLSNLYFSMVALVFIPDESFNLFLNFNNRQWICKKKLRCKTNDSKPEFYLFDCDNLFNKVFFNSLVKQMKAMKDAAEAERRQRVDAAAASSFSAVSPPPPPPSVSAPPPPPSVSAPPPSVSVSPASPPPSVSARSVVDDIRIRRENDEKKQKELNRLIEDRTCHAKSYQCRLYIAQYDKYVELIDAATVTKYKEISNNQSLSPQDKKDEIGKLYQARDNAINVFFEHTKKCLTDGSYSSYNDDEVLDKIVRSTEALQPANEPDFFLNGIKDVHIDAHQQEMCRDNKGNEYPCPPTGPPMTSYDVRTDGDYKNWRPSEIIPSINIGSANGAAQHYGQNWRE